MSKALVEKAQASGPGSISSEAAAARSQHSLRPFKFLCGYGALELGDKEGQGQGKPKGPGPWASGSFLTWIPDPSEENGETQPGPPRLGCLSPCQELAYRSL